MALAEIASIQAQAGDMKAAIQTANSIDIDSRKAKALADIANIQAQVGDKQGALETSKDALQVASRIFPVSPGMRPYIAAIQSEAGDIKAAIQTANGIDDHDFVKALTFARIITVFYQDEMSLNGAPQ